MPSAAARRADPPARLVEAARRALARPFDGRIARVEVPAGGGDPLAWLAAQPEGAKRYWRGRGDGLTLAALGAADLVDVEDLDALEATLAPRLAGAPEAARYLGAVRFAPDAEPAPEWAAFGRVRFVLPRVEWRAEGEAATLALYLTDADRANPEPALAVVAGLAMPAGPTSGDGQTGALPALDPPALFARHDTPERGGWRSSIERALDAFEEGSLQKVVLARRARLRFAAPLDPLVLLARLQAATPRCFHLLVPGADGAAFVAASPERLFRLEGTRVWTEAIAGTRPRGAGAAADQRSHDALLASEKDRHEHGLVAGDVAARLALLTTVLRADAEPHALALARSRHLRARFEGALRPGVTAFDLLRALHPTPAVGGAPRDSALRFIAAEEGFDRGLYAGPVGWIAKNAAEFAVGIRSALVREAEASVFSGAGLVRGSDPEAEWAEVEHKAGDWARALGLG